jgi:prolipoprotein diacylglyceryltransferase
MTKKLNDIVFYTSSIIILGTSIGYVISKSKQSIKQNEEKIKKYERNYIRLN